MLGGCKQKMADGLMTFARNLTLTCCGKQRRYFEIFGNMADTRANFKPNLLLFGNLRYRHFEFETIWRLARQF